MINRLLSRWLAACCASHTNDRLFPRPKPSGTHAMTGLTPVGWASLQARVHLHTRLIRVADGACTDRPGDLVWAADRELRRGAPQRSDSYMVASALRASPASGASGLPFTTPSS